ncbi:hypothetical protein [Streptomyces spectabilis]|uniref:Uncharacterized protein n=1 Tax=Streptomyces spectabilis TaxID=68270 RepID=A0A516RFX3_STRST|nr:hypothetical protein [Streptomyces spectabilis]QDQ14550.1 hypothetical protein FH965_31670 [Streptomyces spectabilis]
MIKRAAVGAAAAALVAIGGGVSLAHAGTDSTAAPASAVNAAPAAPNTDRATTAAWSWVNGQAYPALGTSPRATPANLPEVKPVRPMHVTAAGWLDKHHESVL